MFENEGFNVGEEVVDVNVGDLTEVKEEKQLIPPTKKVKLMVKKGELNSYKDGAWKTINVQLQLVDGIDSTGAMKNKVVFAGICFYADPDVYTKDYFKKKQHLVALSQFLRAIGADLSSVKIGPAFLEEIKGKMVLADITQTKGNDDFGPDNEVKNYRELPAEAMV